MKKTKLKIDIFEVTLNIFYGEVDELNNLINSEYDEDLGGLTFDYKDFYAIFINKEHKDPLRVLVHELIHLSYYIFKSKDIDLNEKTQEIWRYTYDWLFSQIKKRLGI